MLLSGLVACKKYPQDVAKNRLIQNGFQLNLSDSQRAVSSNDTSLLEDFLTAGWQWKSTDSAGKTAFHTAASAGAQGSALWLSNHGLDINQKDASMRTPLIDAAMNNQHGMVDWLIKHGADVTCRDASGKTALWWAIEKGHASTMEPLILKQRQDLDVALLVAATYDNVKVIDVLTSYGASIHAQSDDGRTPLMLAAERGNLEVVKLLLELGANRFTINQQGQTALQLAQAAGKMEMVALLEAKPERDFVVEHQSKIEQQLVEEDLREEEKYQSLSSARSNDSVGSGKTLLNVNKLDQQSIGVKTQIKPAWLQSSTGGLPSHEIIPALVMRRFSQREIPLKLKGSVKNKAVFEMPQSKETSSPFEVSAGTVIPNTSLKIISLKTVSYEQKDSNQPAFVTVVEVQDTRNGATTSWRSDQAMQAHEPIALLEDAVSGKRYIAKAGQRFRSEEGKWFIVTDVRPNQVSVQDEKTAEVLSYPLRGARGQ